VGSVMDMEPIYIRKSEAEVLWEKRQEKLTSSLSQPADTFPGGEGNGSIK